MEGHPTRYPIIDVQIPTVYDRTIAPEGTHIVSMWVRYEPVKPKEGTWDQLREQEGNRLIDVLTEYAPNFRKSIIDWLGSVDIWSQPDNRGGVTDAWTSVGVGFPNPLFTHQRRFWTSVGLFSKIDVSVSRYEYRPTRPVDRASCPTSCQSASAKCQHALVYTPMNLERRVYLTDGNIHHTSHVPGQLLGDRLFTLGGYRTPIEGMYMCGAGTHPGGEVSGAPGHNAAHAVLADHGKSGK